MAHEFESGFFTRKPAWHNLGTVVNEAPSIADAMQLAGLDWPVIEAPMTATIGDKILRVEGHKALFRGTDDVLLGVVGADYNTLQNTKAFSFFEPFLKSGLVELEAAGSLRKGKNVWVLARIKGVEGDVVNGDRVLGYLLLSNAHDGTQAVRVQLTKIRVVCWNTLRASLASAEAGTEKFLSVRHSAKLELGLDAVQKSVDLMKQTFDLTIESYRTLAEAGCSEEQLRKYVRQVFNYQARPEEEMPKCWDYIATVFERGPGVGTITGVSGSWWAAYNAVTDYIDHGQGRGRSEEGRLHSSWFGVGANRSADAMKIALSQSVPVVQ